MPKTGPPSAGSARGLDAEQFRTVPRTILEGFLSCLNYLFERCARGVTKTRTASAGNACGLDAEQFRIGSVQFRAVPPTSPPPNPPPGLFGNGSELLGTDSELFNCSVSSQESVPNSSELFPNDSWSLTGVLGTVPERFLKDS